jgi:peptidoglycan hydrolase-like protein with peptidoglycan-binding domain
MIGSALLAVAVSAGVALTSTASAQPATSVAELSLASRSPGTNLPAWPVLSQNRVPNALSVVKSLQYLLNAHGAHLVVDGFFGSQTDAAVREFQGSHGLVVDGVVGEQTWSRLIVTVDGTPDSPPLLAVDGVFGPRTDEWVRDFQQTLAYTIDTPVDGIVGPVTWRAMMTDYLED